MFVETLADGKCLPILNLTIVQVFDAKVFIMVNIKKPDNLICTNCLKIKRNISDLLLLTTCTHLGDKTCLLYELQRCVTPLCGGYVLSNLCELDFCGIKQKSA